MAIQCGNYFPFGAFVEAGGPVCRAPILRCSISRCSIFKEKNMKLKSLLSLAAAAVLAVSMSVMAQAPPTGKVHGHVTDPTGVPKGGGTVGLRGSFVALNTPSCNSRFRSVNSSCLSFSSFSNSVSYFDMASACGE